MAEQLQQSDHDLLIAIHTKVERVIVDVKEIKDNTAKRVDDLERNKLDKSVADKLLADSTFIYEKLEEKIEVLENKFDVRVVWLERIAYGGLAILSALEYYYRVFK